MTEHPTHFQPSFPSADEFAAALAREGRNARALRGPVAWRRVLMVLGACLFAAACTGPAVSSSPIASRGATPPSSATGGGGSAQPTRNGTAQPTDSALPSDLPKATPIPTTNEPHTAPPIDIQLGVLPFVQGLDALTYLTHAGDGSGDLYVVAQVGLIYRIAADGSVQGQPFLDIDDRIASGGEQGLLGLAFHPDFESTGRFFVNYTDNRGDTVVSEFTMDLDDRTTVSPDSERVLLQIDQPYPNHNGGMVTFGPDGYLYIGMGDGGSGGDPLGMGQAMGELLGKILRIDVNSGDPYGIPVDNPFVGQELARPEIWSLGWRNPWRFSFDRETGAMFIGDVGQGDMEEVDIEPAGEGGRNYGWNFVEGFYCFASDPCDRPGLTAPVVGIDHSSTDACAITGGYVYRGTALSGLVGTYVFSDYCAGTLWTFEAASALASGSAEPVIVGESGLAPSSFGEDEAGELYLTTLEGEIFRLVEAH